LLQQVILLIGKNWLKVEKMKVGPDNQHTVVIELKVCACTFDQDLKVEEEINSLLNGRTTALQ